MSNQSIKKKECKQKRRAWFPFCLGGLLQDSAWRPSKKKRLGIYYIAHSGCYTVRWPFCIEEEEEKSGRLSRSIKKRRWWAPLIPNGCQHPPLYPQFGHHSIDYYYYYTILWLLWWWYLFYSFVGSYTNPFSSTCSIMYSAELLTMLDTTKDNITHGRRENLGEIFQKKIYIKRRETV